MKDAPKMTTVLIADDHPLFRSGIRTELERIPHLKLIGEAGDGTTALDLIIKHEPDLAILDIRMPGKTGLEVAETLMEAGSPTRIILLTMHREKAIFLKALDVGVAGYVLKDSLVNEIHDAVRAVVDGRYYLSQELSPLLMEAASRRSRSDSDKIWQEKLTPAELNILRLRGELKSNQEIADMLFISKRTVENHCANIRRKLALDGRNSLIKFAVEHRSEL